MIEWSDPTDVTAEALVDTPWYPTMRLFRQRKLGEWGEVIERMAGALGELAGVAG